MNSVEIMSEYVKGSQSSCGGSGNCSRITGSNAMSNNKNNNDDDAV